MWGLRTKGAPRALRTTQDVARPRCCSGGAGAVGAKAAGAGAAGAEAMACPRAANISSHQLNSNISSHQLECELRVLAAHDMLPYSSHEIARIQGDHYTPLHVAVGRGDCVAIELLLGAKADAGAPTLRGWTPLILASLNNYPHVCHALRKHGVDEEATCCEGKTARYYFAHTSIYGPGEDNCDYGWENKCIVYSGVGGDAMVPDYSGVGEDVMVPDYE